MPRKSFAATGTTDLTNDSQSNVGTVAVQITGTWAGSLTFTGRVIPNRGLTTSDNVTLGYTTPASASVVTTAITANGIFWVRADGLMVSINLGTLSSGTPVVDYQPLNG